MPRGGKREGAGRKPKAKVTKVAPGTPGAGRGGVMPPAETRMVPGQTLNPKGRPGNVGRTVRELMNDMGAAGLTAVDLKRIHRDLGQPQTRRAAALRLLNMAATADVADFQPVMDGSKSLEQLRDEDGVDTSVVKKCKRVVRTFRGKDGDERGEEESVELELLHKSGEEFDRVVEHTDGRPTQRVELRDEDGSLRTAAQGAVATAALVDGIAKRLGVKR